MSLPLSYRPKAREEIDGAYSWYERQREGLGEEFLEDLNSRLGEIQLHPEMYAVLYRRVRAVPMGRFPYVIYYRIEDGEICVIAVQHGHRHPRGWRKRI